MSGEHTPGPWRVDPDFPGDIQAEGTEIATTFSAPQEGVQLRILGPITVDLNTRLANARLTAAAPEILAALERAEAFIAGFEDDETQDGITEMLAAIRAAIAKAKGIV